MASVATDRFIGKMCRESFHAFFQEFWAEIAAEELVDTWYIKLLCRELQTISERVFDNKKKLYDFIWNCPPGTSKSSVVSRAWQPWIWTRMPHARFISGSYRDRLALELARGSRDIINCARYARYYPEITLRPDQNTKGHFINTRGGGRWACGVGGAVMGSHAHFIAVDDPIDPNEALSDILLAEANHWMREQLSRRKVNLLLTPTVLIMQRLHQNDPSGDMRERGTNVRLISIPGDCREWEVTPPELRDFYSEDGLLDPIRLPWEALDDARKELLDTGYACQYGQSPIPRGGAMFKVEVFNYQNTAPSKWKRGPVRYWDKAATRKFGAFTVGTKGALDENDRVWILDVVRDRLDSAAREQLIDRTAELDGRHCRQVVEKEPAGAGKESAESTVKRLTLKGYRASMDPITGDKELRADPLSQHVNMGNVVLLVGLWNKLFVEELRYFPRSKYKDQVDSSAGMFSQLVKTRYRIGAVPKRNRVK